MNSIMKELLMFLFVCLWTNSEGEAMAESDFHDNLESGKHVGLNKTSFKTFHLKGGDVDCIDINKQPSLDHPLLKNHKVQMEPVAFPSGMVGVFTRNAPSKLTKPGEESCPPGTVPIIRTRKKLLAMEKAFGNYFTDGNVSKTHVVFVRTRVPQLPVYRGVYGYASVFNLSVGPNQATLANVAVHNNGHLLAAGWMVSPIINGDSLPRVFIFRRTGSPPGGCYNMNCQGFVQVHPQLTIGYPISPVTEEGKNYSVDVKFSIFEDQQTGNWWLTVSEHDIKVGYWPKEVVGELQQGSGGMIWGGMAFNAGDTGPSPPMGSGHKPDGSHSVTSHVAFFRRIHYIDQSFTAQVPDDEGLIQIVDPSGCYGLDYPQYHKDPLMGFYFNYGGPGGNCGS